MREGPPQPGHPLAGRAVRLGVEHLAVYGQSVTAVARSQHGTCRRQVADVEVRSTAVGAARFATVRGAYSFRTFDASFIIYQRVFSAVMIDGT